MWGDLTVLESFAYSCHLRAPAHYGKLRRKALVGPPVNFKDPFQIPVEF